MLQPSGLSWPSVPPGTASLFPIHPPKEVPWRIGGTGGAGGLGCGPGAHPGREPVEFGSDQWQVPSWLHLMRNCPVGAVISVWPPEQADSVIMLRGLVPLFRKFSFRPITFWCRRMFPVGVIILGWEFFPPNSEFCRCHEGFNPVTLKVRFHICQRACLLLKPGGNL